LLFPIPIPELGGERDEEGGPRMLDGEAGCVIGIVRTVCVMRPGIRQSGNLVKGHDHEHEHRKSAGNNRVRRQEAHFE
jgi:hypothetical protein